MTTAYDEDGINEGSELRAAILRALLAGPVARPQVLNALGIKKSVFKRHVRAIRATGVRVNAVTTGPGDDNCMYSVDTLKRKSKTPVLRVA